jgi:hypothetical protein
MVTATAAAASPAAPPRGPVSSTQTSHAFPEAFEAAMKRMFGAYTIDMTSPAPSAGSRVQTLRHIRLVPKSGAALVIGWANPSEGKAELGTLGHTLALSKQRFGRELAIPPLEYLRFIDAAKKLLEERGMTVSVIAHKPSEASDCTPPSPRRAPTLPYVGLIVASASTLGFIASQIVR